VRDDRWRVARTVDGGVISEGVSVSVEDELRGGTVRVFRKSALKTNGVGQQVVWCELLLGYL
jgi:hypothetical protein